MRSMKHIIAFALLYLSLAAAAEVKLDIDLTKGHPVSENLYGIFFEEINHAGEGGLYGELIQDRSFDALAATSGFHEGQFWPLTDEMLLCVGHYEGQLPEGMVRRPGDADPTNTTHNFLNGVNQLNQPVSWHKLDSAKLALTREDPISKYNTVALNLSTSEPDTGISNTGYWGLPLNGGWIYRFSIYIKGPSDTKVKVLLQSEGGKDVYAETSFDGINGTWQKFSTDITPNTTDFNAEVAVLLTDPGSVLIDSLSFFPGGSIREGWQNPYPFREDMLTILKELKPRFVRFPGGCYVEGGDFLKNRFPWKTNLGLNEHRSGHLNDIWGYWSTDGLGLFEYMLMADELQAEPIYVINNGISHVESVPPSKIEPLLKETLDALEFITGPESSEWGSVRASMGRKEPWSLNYLAIGNEDCGKPFYVEDYNVFYAAIKALYPDMTLIANCNLGDAATTELWDWHSYDDALVMFNRMHEFDSMNRETDPPVFVSEYAVVGGGGQGNLKAAVAEASFMTGMERNSDIVQLASYAPLFVHFENRAWPTNMIVFDNHRIYLTPSYLVQKLFSIFQGQSAVQTDVVFGEGIAPPQRLVAASATCQDKKCDRLAIKASNFNALPQIVTVEVASKEGVVYEDEAHLYHVSGNQPDAENSFDDPEKIVLKKDNITIDGHKHGKIFRFKATLPAWSASVLELTQKLKPS